ncbi:MAG TPA: penicillin acylase family protein [Terriglobales bacterium]|nr:penicillin acylase family protein [Terriglobales bacterium]
MATTVAGSYIRRTSNPVLRVTLITAAIVIVVLAGATLWFFGAARAGLPQLDGTISVSGLNTPVQVIRDHQGVPHIRAHSLDDLFFAQGYVTAQDRLWQMDLTRRFAAGELSEVFGAAAIPQDREQRILGFRHLAETSVQYLSDSDKRYLDDYSRGVNAYIAERQQKRTLPLEFRILRYEPKPWTVADSLLVGINMAQTLNFYWVPEMLGRDKVATKVGPQLAAELFPTTSWRDHPPSMDPSLRIDLPQHAVYRHPRVGDTVPRASYQASSLIDVAAHPPGSNDWVISGAHTASGKPLLSNDMHLPIQIPNVWYEAQLEAPDFNVAGVTLPGLPFVIVGHNQRIAWGFTNVGPAVTDLYVENFNADGEYQAPDGWKEPEHRKEVIHVKDGSDIDLDVVVTRHGPVITDLFPGETRKLALKWNIYDPGIVQIPFLDVNAAQNWDQFRKAFSRYGAPSQNVVYGDVDGNIGYFVNGKIPIRTNSDAIAPVPGNDNAHEWTGYIPFDQLPTAYNPASGILATANGRITPDGYPYIIGFEWDASIRTQRIYRYLEANKKFTPADMLTLQTDVYSDYDRFLAQRFAYAVDHSQTATPRAKQAAELLRNWDGILSVSSPAPTIVSRARDQLQRLLLEPKLGAASDDPKVRTGWREYHWFMSSAWLESTLTHQPKNWLPPNFSSYDELLTAALDAAVTAKDAPPGLSTWNWGKVHTINVQHILFSRFPIIRRWAETGVLPLPGDGTTVKQAAGNVGPSQRLTVDFSNLDNSTLNIVNGQGGNLLSPYFNDQWGNWYHGTALKLPFSDDAVDGAKEHELTLEPGK